MRNTHRRDKINRIKSVWSRYVQTREKELDNIIEKLSSSQLEAFGNILEAVYASGVDSMRKKP